MARGKPVKLATRVFETRGEATAFFKRMLNSYQPGDRVDDADSLELISLLERHPEFESKVGSGVECFEVIMTQHGTQCFRVVRTDGTGTDFSYPICISGKPPSRKQEVSQAFRWAVRYDLYKARDDFFALNTDANDLVTCAVTGEQITRDKAHMDHRPPMTFEVIVTTFLTSQGLSLDAVPTTTGQDDQVSPEVTDLALIEAFRVYHMRVAQLDYIKSSINLAEASRHRLKQGRVSIQQPEG